MARRIGTDWNLQVRMFVTMLLLAALYLLFADVLLHYGFGFLPMAVVLGGLALLQYYYSDRLVLLSTGAREVSPAEAPELHAIIERLAAQADLPKPRVAVVDTPVPNAFATGRSPSHAAIAATTGLMQRLSPEELEAVLAHEMTHVMNRDMTVMTLASFFASIASYIVQMSLWFGWGGGFGGGYGGGRRDEGENPMLVYAVSIAVWIVSYFLMNALSRYREYAADRGSALLTGAPEHLASALMKISGAMSRVPRRDLRRAEALNAFFIVPALSSESLFELFATHPTLEHRLAQLRRIEQQMAGRR
jgi:heat shock protein HtpX